MRPIIIILFCCLIGGALFADTTISANISSSQTWTLAGSPYVITNNIEISGTSAPVLTIEAGVELRLEAGKSIGIGNASYIDRTGGMIVNGTAALPVLFTSQTEAAWNYIFSNKYASLDQIIFNHAILEKGGSSGTGMFNVNGGNPAFTNCSFRQSSSYGIYHSSDTANASVSATSFQNNGGYPLYWNPQAVDLIGDDNSFSSNIPNRVLIKSIVLTEGLTWTNKGIAFEMAGDLTLNNLDNALTLQTGVQVLFRTGKRLLVGSQNYDTSAGKIIANPGVILGAVNPGTGWNGVFFQKYVRPSALSGTIKDVSATALAAVTINSANAVTLQNCVFSGNNTYAVYSYAGTNFSLSNCSISGNAKTIAVYAEDMRKLLAGNIYTGNTENRIQCLGGNILTSATWIAQGTPIWVTADITHDTIGTPVLEIPSGVELQFAAGKYFYVGNPYYADYLPGLNATGVSFRAADPQAGWGGIQFRKYLTPSTLDSCIIRDVIHPTLGAVTISSTSLVTLQDCVITENDSYAVYIYAEGSFLMSACTISDNAKTVSIYANDMQKLLNGNVYTDNTENRIHCLGGPIFASATWINQGTPIWVTENIVYDINDITVLSIPYGTELQFASARYFSVGSAYYPDHHNALNAIGVTFRGAESTPGYWVGLIFHIYSDPSLLSGCTIKDAGYNNAAAIKCNNTNSTITGSTIENNLANGIWMADNSMVALSGNTLTTSGSYPLSIHVDKLRVLTGQNYFTGNTIDRVEVRSGEVTVSGIWINPGVPYQPTGNINIRGSNSPHIKILPGTIFTLPNNMGLYVGDPYYSDQNGSLEADGVTFTRSSPADVPNGLIFYRYATLGASSFTNCVFEYQRSASAVYVDGNDPVFDSSIFRYNLGLGLVVTATGRASAINCQFIDNGGYPISTTATAFDAVSGVGNYFSGNNPNRILMGGGTLAQDYTWDNPSVPVEVSSSIYVNAFSTQPTLSINSGLVLLFNTNTGLYIGDAYFATNSGGLKAEGATFSALNNTTGGWNGIQFQRYSLDNSYLSGSVVEYGGLQGNIGINNTALPYIDSCIIRYGTTGIFATGSQVNTVITKNHIQSNGVGVYATNNANPVIGGSLGNANSIDANTSFGVQNTTTSFNVNALYNWWGSPSGPHHVTLNPAGLGDNVSSYVDFDPWRTIDIGDAPSRFHLLTPVNASVLETLTPVLDWEDAIDPTPGDTVTYTLLIAKNSGFTLGLITIPSLTASVYHVPASTLMDDTRYYWKVNAKDLDDQTVWSYENYFHFDTAVPEAPLAFTLISPTYNEEVYLTSNLLSWQASSDPDPGDYVTYTVYWDVSAGFETAGSLTTSNTSAYSGFNAPGSIIYWKVKAFDTTGRETFSPVLRYLVDLNAKPRAPVAFTLTRQSTNIQVNWDSVPGADYYDLYFSTDPYSGFSLLQANLQTPEFLHLGAATGPRGFYYVVTRDSY